MNQKQLQKTNMIDATLVVLNLNKPLWLGNTTFNTGVTTIQTNMGVLNTADTVRLAVTMPLTETKGQAKVALIAATMAHAAAGIGYAASVNNSSLKSTCQITESALVKTADADLGNACMIIYNAVQPFIGSMGTWGVNATTLAALQSDVTTFNALVGTPVGQISIKAAAGVTIDTQIATMEGILTDTIDTLMVQFKTGHAAFYNAYTSARKIHNTGVHHSVTFDGFTYNSNGVAAIPNVKVELLLNNKLLRTHYTDASGKYRFTRLQAGTYVMNVSAPGYVSQSKTFVITTLQEVETDFMLHSVGGTTGGGATTSTPVTGVN